MSTIFYSPEKVFNLGIVAIAERSMRNEEKHKVIIGRYAMHQVNFDSRKAY